MVGRRLRHITRQIDNLPDIDQAWVLDLGIQRQDVPPAHPKPTGDLSERISLLNHVGAALRRMLTRVITGRRGNSEYLPRVDPPPEPGIRRLDGVDGGAALPRDATQCVAPLDRDVAGTA